MPFEAQEISLTRLGKRLYKLNNSLIYKGKYDNFTVPAGSTTDFASVPQIVSWLIPSDGDYTLAAILHDMFCDHLNDVYRLKKDALRTANKIWLDPDSGYFPDARQTDAIFRRVMRELGVPYLRRWTIWSGVRYGALINPARCDGWYKDIPLVLFFSLLASPIVVPASILAGLGLVIDNIVTKILFMCGIK